MLTHLSEPYTLTGTLTPPDHHITAGASADSVIVGSSEAQPETKKKQKIIEAIGSPAQPYRRHNVSCPCWSLNQTRRSRIIRSLVALRQHHQGGGCLPPILVASSEGNQKADAHPYLRGLHLRHFLCQLVTGCLTHSCTAQTHLNRALFRLSPG